MVLKPFVMLAAALALAASAQAAGLGERHMAALKKDCSLCHAETPAAKAPAEAACTACHGDLAKLGNKPLSKGAVNPHLNHVEELYCSDCHHMHKPSTNYCLDCHDDAFLGFKVP